MIRKEHGGILRPIDVVAFAEDESTALHARFEWDDGEAGKLYRLEQARFIIRSVPNWTEPGKPPVPFYTSLPPDRKNGDSYRHTGDVLRCPKLCKLLLAQALRDAESWRLKYERLAELKPVFRAIEKVRKSG